jgi:hypothetical protein
MPEIRNPGRHDFDSGARTVDRKRRAVQIAPVLPQRCDHRRRLGHVYEPILRYVHSAKGIRDLRTEPSVEAPDMHVPATGRVQNDADGLGVTEGIVAREFVGGAARRRDQTAAAEEFVRPRRGIGRGQRQPRGGASEEPRPRRRRWRQIDDSYTGEIRAERGQVVRVMHQHPRPRDLGVRHDARQRIVGVMEEKQPCRAKPRQRSKQEVDACREGPRPQHGNRRRRQTKSCAHGIGDGLVAVLVHVRDHEMR